MKIIPAYWFHYNHYALQRNEWKYKDRDARFTKELELEYSALAPDSINEIFNALHLMALFAGKSYFKHNAVELPSDEACALKGKALFESNDKILDEIEMLAEGFENSKRKVVLLKAWKAYASYKEMIRYYAVGKIVEKFKTLNGSGMSKYIGLIANASKREALLNLGGQLMPMTLVEQLLNEIRTNKLKSWDAVHLAYKKIAQSSIEYNLQHAIASLMEIDAISSHEFNANYLSNLFRNHVETNESVFRAIVQSREKDMTNPFRKMVYSNDVEMETVLGKLSENTFIIEKEREKKALVSTIESILAKLNLDLVPEKNHYAVDDSYSIF